MFGKKPPADPPPHSQQGPTADSGDRAVHLNAENTRILGMVARDYIKDRRSKRRWSWFFRSILIIYLGVLLFSWVFGDDDKVSAAHTALVELDGLIAPGAVSADEINGALGRAFKSSAAGVVLRINSPGGTPVQAAQINAEIYRLRSKYPGKPFYVVISDICASGGYYVAVAADEIYAQPASIVGSIGVRMDSFGFVDAMDKLGIERRLITAGEDKAILDPFTPVQPNQVAHAQKMLGEVHQQFIDAVEQGRGDRLSDQEELYSGLFWSGERARELGLVDSFGSASEVARNVIGAERLVTYNPRKGFLAELSKELGVRVSAWSQDMIGSVVQALTGNNAVY